ncbi:MAG: hypothetical protein WBD40_13965 [Tepidisphaeraceae bacterium]
MISVLLPAGAHAAVSLAFVDQDGTSNGSVNVLPNGTFNVRLNLTSANTAADRTTAIDYYLTILGAGSGLFSIQDRNWTGSPYAGGIDGSGLYNDDATVEALPGALLDPRNDHDLGGGVLDEDVPTMGTSFLVAIFTIKVDPSTPVGTYSLQSTSDPGTGWVGAAPDFNDNEFAQHANYSIVVIPEPASAGFAACGAALLICSRRRSGSATRVA